MANHPNTSALTVQTFGEKTCLPISVTKAIVRATDPLPFIDKSLASVELSLTNKAVPGKDVTAKLELSLPLGASVKKFELLRDGAWYPATAVPKKTARTVLYKEKERGRDVAAVSNAAAAANLFEIEISPVPYGEEIRCRLEILTSGSAQELVDRLQGDETATVVQKIFHGADDATFDAEVGALVGKSFGKSHFVCKIPPIAATDERNKLDHVTIVWDASASTANSDSIDSCCSRLKELLVKADTQKVDVYTFGVGDPLKLGSFDKVESVIQTIKSIKHDGGTDITTLPPLVAELAQNSKPTDAVLMFTDGADNLGSTPAFENSTDIPFPVHCIVPETDAINMRNLKVIAAASPNLAGTVLLAKKEHSYIHGILHPQPMLHSIEVDQDDDAFMEEVDDGFRCVPDHRLQVLGQTISGEGLLISGVLGGSSSVTKLTAKVELSRGKYRHFHFMLREPPNKSFTEDTSICPTLFLEEKHEANNEKDQTDLAARILGHVYAEELYRQAEAFGIRSGLCTERVREELAVSYGFCSPESSLLMLYEKVQFVEHGIMPPEGHPVAGDVTRIEKEDSGVKAYAPGEIGGLKNDNQREAVVQLAARLNEFLAAETSPPTKRSSGGSGEDLAMCRMACYLSDASAGSGRSATQRSRRVGRGRRSAAGGVAGRQPPPAAPSPVAYCASFQRASAEVEESFRPSEMAGRSVAGGEALLAGRSLAAGGPAGRQPPPAAPFSARSFALDEYDNYRRAPSMEVEERCYSPEMADMCGDLCVDYSDNLAGEMRAFEDRVTCAAASCVTPPAGAGVSAPEDPKDYIASLEAILQQSGGDNHAWTALYETKLASLGGHASASPSFFLNTARVLIQHAKADVAIRIAANCLEGGHDDVQLLRSVGYLFLSSATAHGIDLAARLFQKVKDLAPLEPQSYMDVGLTGYWKAWRAFESWDGTLPDTAGAVMAILQEELPKVQGCMVHVLTHRWPGRFSEIEWPALILLHHVADLVQSANSHDSFSSIANLTEWPVEIGQFFPQARDGEVMANALRCNEGTFDPAVMVWMAWDTDNTDVDLHVYEPSNHMVYYGNKRGQGSLLSRDFTQGYGPEVYLAKQGQAARGEYRVHAKYYASHQDSPLTGSTSVVIWIIENAKGSNSGSNNKKRKQVRFRYCRLDTHKGETHVATAVCHDEDRNLPERTKAKASPDEDRNLPERTKAKASPARRLLAACSNRRFGRSLR